MKPEAHHRRSFASALTRADVLAMSPRNSVDASSKRWGQVQRPRTCSRSRRRPSLSCDTVITASGGLVENRGRHDTQSQTSAADSGALSEFVHRSLMVEPSSLGRLADLAADALGARSGRLFVADYALRRVRELRGNGTMGDEVVLDGTIAGRAFASGAPVEQGDGPVRVWVPLAEGSERIGLVELVFDESPAGLETWGELVDVVRMMVLMVVSGRRYTDVLLQARRAQPLSDAAEAQWDLLPPLSYAGAQITVSGILEPAYSIGGDSFDYAINPGRLDLAIVDAVGHGLPAVLMASAAINTLRNARREQRTLEQAYHQVDRRIAEQFGQSNYVTGQIATLDVGSGRLMWLNAGHVLPLLVRNGSFVGELECAPSTPMGLGGRVVQVAVDSLQSGDRVLFHTDGVIESRSRDGAAFTTERLADFLVRATMDGATVAETVRRLSASVIAHVGAGLRDDATLFLVEYTNHDPVTAEVDTNC